MLISIGLVTSVSAKDLNESDMVYNNDMSDDIFSNEEPNELLSIEDNQALTADNESNVLAATYYPTSVSQLKTHISSANPGDTIILSGTYKIHVGV